MIEPKPRLSRAGIAAFSLVVLAVLALILYQVPAINHRLSWRLDFASAYVRGVIDPVKVVRGALENAASIAAMILTTDVLITDVPAKESGPAMPPGGMGGMDY